MKKSLSLFTISLACWIISASSIYAKTPLEVVNNWNQNNKYEQVSPALKDSISALIIFDRNYKSYKKYVLDNQFRIETTTTIHRKIKILSQAVLEDFNTVLVPSIGDMFIQNEIEEIKGRTIKSDGTIIELDSTEMRETTLPANSPFLSNYNGKVKLLALSGVSVGDEVEYYFTIKTDAAIAKSKYLRFGRINYITSYPSLETSHTIGFNKSFNLQSYSINTDINLVEQPGVSNDDLVYFKASTKNLPASLNEKFNLKYPLTMSIFYQIYEDKEDEMEKDWSSIKDMKIVKSSILTQYYLSRNLMYATVIKELKTKKTFNSKLDKIVDLVNEKYTNDKDAFISSSSPSLDRYNLPSWINLIHSIDADINIWYVLDKNNGEVNEKIPTINQFDDIIIEVEYKNKKYHLPLFRPLDVMNEIDYDYHNTKALKVSVDKKNKITYAFEKFVPIYDNTQNKTEKTYKILVSLGDTSQVSIEEKIKNSGEYSRRSRYPIYLEKNFEKDATWKEGIKRNIKNKFQDAQINKFTVGSVSIKYPTAVNWDISYIYPLNITQSKVYASSISELIGSNISFGFHCDKRKTDAYLGYPYSLDNTYLISTNSTGKVLENDKLNYNFSNNIGSIQSKVEVISPNEIKLNVKYSITKDQLSASEWCEYVALENAYDNLLKELIIIQK